MAIKCPKFLMLWHTPKNNGIPPMPMYVIAPELHIWHLPESLHTGWRVHVFHCSASKGFAVLTNERRENWHEHPIILSSIVLLPQVVPVHHQGHPERIGNWEHLQKHTNVGITVSINFVLTSSYAWPHPRDSYISCDKMLPENITGLGPGWSGAV